MCGSEDLTTLEVRTHTHWNQCTHTHTHTHTGKNTHSLCRCSLSFIDFEGLSDGDSVKRILSIVKPRQLVSTTALPHTHTSPYISYVSYALPHTHTSPSSSYVLYTSLIIHIRISSCTVCVCVCVCVLPQILVHGSADSTNHLRDFARSSLWLAKGKLFTPRVGDSIDASTESHIYQVPSPSLSLSSTHTPHRHNTLICANRPH